MNRYAGIIVNNSSIKLDKIFTYEIPDELIEEIKLGHRVKVPFGNGNKLIDGFVFELFNDFKEIGKIKKINRICDSFPLLTEKDIKLIKAMKKSYLCTYLEAIKPFIPKGITKGNSFKTSKVICINKELQGKFLKEPYISIYKIVQENNGRYNKTEISRKFNISISSINTLIKYEHLLSKEIVIHRFDNINYEKYSKKILTQNQQNAVNNIMNSNKNVFLIHGVTGSGKTEIYMNLVSKMIENGKQSIILVPEISLTPQMVERFKGRFGQEIAVFHSKLSEGERFDEWMRVKRGEVKAAIGARSALFLPFDNLGLIVIDEEHVSSYKSESNPKYSAKEIAIIKSQLNDCKVILGSATPSVETYYECTNNSINLIKIDSRVDGSKMPEIEIVDMREELINNNKSIFSNKLYEEINNSLSKGEQVILFLNRRGFSSFVSCRKCGYVFKCDHCDISLTYHSYGDYLSCHYCGKRIKMSRTCPKCGSKYVKYFGIGTEKLEEEAKKCFPKARTIRMDFDTTRKKNSHKDIYESFKKGEADILIGTQMVAKGLDFQNVTLVGVIAADLSLNLPDYRSQERTFQLITQVSGRAGRGEKTGKVIVQTYNPDEFSIKCAANNDYDKFYEEEINLRYTMNYPPFSKIMLINLSSENEKVLINNINNLGNIIRNKISLYDKIDLLGPCPCSINKIKNSYRWQIILKGQFSYEMAESIKEIVYENISINSKIKVSIDINPNNLI